MGIYPSQWAFDQRNRSINLRNVSFLISFLVLFISTAGAFLFIAKTTMEYSDNFFIALTELACTNSFLIVWWKATNIAELMQNSENYIKKSELI